MIFDTPRMSTCVLLMFIPALRGYNIVIFSFRYRWEHSCKAPYVRGGVISHAVRCNLREASDRLCAVSDSHLAHAVAAALDLAIVGSRSPDDTYMLSIQLTLLMAKAAVTYFFLCVSEKGLFLCLYVLKLVTSFIFSDNCVVLE